MPRLLLTTLALWALSLGATDYYIDATDGSDGNNGLSPATAWQSVAKIRSLLANGGSIQPGDRFLFQRGETWDASRLYVDYSGTAALPITFGHYGDANAPLPVIDATGQLPGAAMGNQWTKQNSNGSWYLSLGVAPARLFYGTTERLRSTTLATLGVTDNAGAVGTWFYDDSANRLYIFTNGNPSGNNVRGSVQPAAVQVALASHLVFDGLDLRGGYIAALQLATSSNIMVQNCALGAKARNGLSASTNSSIACDNLTIQNNTINSAFTFFYGDGSERGCGDGVSFFDGVTNSLIDGNTFTNWAHNAVEFLGDCAICTGVNGNSVTNNTVTAPDIPYAHPFGVDGFDDKARDNVFAYNVASDCRTASQLNGNNNQYHHNYFFGQRASPSNPRASAHGITLAIYGAGLVCHDNLYEHNLIFDTDESGFLIRNYGFGHADVENNTVQNNLIVNTGLAPYNSLYPLHTGILLHSANGVGGQTIRNNLYFSTSGANVFVHDDDLNQNYTSASFDTRNGQNGYVVENNLDADPLFTNSGSDDFSLSTGSPAIDAGFTGPTSSPFIGSAPDIGPEEAALPLGVYNQQKDAYYNTIQAALADLLPNVRNDIFILPAIYNEPLIVNGGMVVIHIGPPPGN